MVDPQQRLLLEAGAQLLSAAPDAAKDAAGGADSRWLSSVGVFVGERSKWLYVRLCREKIGLSGAQWAMVGTV